MLFRCSLLQYMHLYEFKVLCVHVFALIRHSRGDTAGSRPGRRNDQHFPGHITPRMLEFISPFLLMPLPFRPPRPPRTTQLLAHPPSSNLHGNNVLPEPGEVEPVPGVTDLSLCQNFQRLVVPTNIARVHYALIVAP